MYNRKKQRRFGQNFLTDINIIVKILRYSKITKNDIVLEIGPGKGALTEKLVQKCKKLYLIEIDTELVQNELEKFTQIDKVKLINKSIIETDFNQFENDIFIIGNLPYNISIKIITYITKYITKIKKSVFMIQKEVAERITALPETKEYNSLTVFLQNYFVCNKLFNVSKNCFSPKPKVESSIIELAPKKNIFDLKYYDEFSSFLKASFRNKRKTLINSLTNNFNIKKNVIENILLKNGFNLNVRAEQINPDQFKKLFLEILN